MWYLGGFKLPPQPDRVLSVVDKKILKKKNKQSKKRVTSSRKGNFPKNDLWSSFIRKSILGKI